MSSSSIDFIVEPGGQLQGSIHIPGDKSISHRTVMFGALAKGITTAKGLLKGEDVLRTIAAFKAMGVQFNERNNDHIEIHGVGLHGLTAPSKPLDMGNSGTAMRLMTGILAGQQFESTLIGDHSLSKRPMTRVTDPISSMGANIQTHEGGLPPLVIHSNSSLRGIKYELPIASAQVKSAVLLAALYAQGMTTVIEPTVTRDHTERLLVTFGYPVEASPQSITLTGGNKLLPQDLVIPADISSAAFFIVGALISKNSKIKMHGVGMNPTRVGIINILKEMGAKLSISNPSMLGNEPVADIEVESSQLNGIRIPQDQISLAIDEFPILFIAAACAQGQTVLQGAAELRVKESDRISVMAKGLRTIGIDVIETEDGLIIKGGHIIGGDIDSFGDHRVAMAFVIAGLCAERAIRIADCRNINTSFPGFVDVAQSAGLAVGIERG